MSDPVTTNIQLAVPTRGSDVGTWDVPVNGDMTILDACFGSVTTKSLSNVSPVLLSVSEAQANVIRLTGALSANIAVQIPNTPVTIVKSWTIENLCTGAFYVTLGNQSGGQVVGLPPGEAVDVYSDGTDIKYRNLGRIGSYMDLATSSIPSWITASSVPPYLACEGATYSSATYPILYSILGTTTLPDSRGRNRASLNAGTNRITTAVSGIDGNTRFSGGGVEGVTLDTSMIPAHNHPASVTDPGHTHNVIGGPNSAGGVYVTVLSTTGIAQLLTDRQSTGITVSTSNTGGGAVHQNMPPTYIGGITMIRAA